MGRDVLAVHVVPPDETGHGRDLAVRWLAWRPEVPLVLIESPQHTLGPPIARFVREQRAAHVMVLIGEVAPAHWWERVLFNRRGGVIARHVSASTDAVVCRLRFRLGRTSPRVRYHPPLWTVEVPRGFRTLAGAPATAWCRLRVVCRRQVRRTAVVLVRSRLSGYAAAVCRSCPGTTSWWSGTACLGAWVSGGRIDLA